MNAENIYFEHSLFKTYNADSAKILLVEDEAIVAEDLREQLEEMNYIVCGIADNSEQAIALAIEKQPDVIMMDIVLKGERDGIHTATQISKELNIPVIFATAYSDMSTLTRATQAAPYGYITKPYNSRDARAAIEVALYKSTLEKQLKESEKWFSATLRCVADGVIATDQHGLISFINPAGETLLDCKFESLIGKDLKSSIRITENDTKHNPLSTLAEELKPNSPRIFFGLELIDFSGNKKHVDLSMASIQHQGKIIGAVVAVRNIDERILAEKALRESEERFRAAFEFAPIGMALVSMQGIILQSNTALARMINFDAEDVIKNNFNFNNFFSPQDHLTTDHSLRQLLGGDLPFVQFDSQLKTIDGKNFDVHITTSLLSKDGLPVCYLHQVFDLTDRKKYESKILHLAHYDSLTNLPNRAYLVEEIERTIAICKQKNNSFALVFCDLDHFKEINDSLGHEAGDKLLQESANEMRRTLRQNDFIARLGGDEFVFLLPNTTSTNQVESTINKLKNILSKTFHLDDHEIRIGASFGICFYPNDGEDATTLMKHADIALYQVKNTGRNNLSFYNKVNPALGGEKVRLMTNLRNALDRHEFYMHYQPIIDLETGKTVFLEALIRWKHPSIGNISPDDFLPFAEESGLMKNIGEWLINESMSACALWNKGRETVIPVSINISSSQLNNESFYVDISKLLTLHQLTPKCVILELTEHHFLSDSEQTRQNLEKLKKLGVAIAIDDFGTGYSSLSYIVRFTPSRIKIDRSFIHGIEKDIYCNEMIETITSITKRLPIVAIAEGVENKKQLDYLVEKGYKYGQGFLFSKPIPESNIVTLLDKNLLPTV